MVQNEVQEATWTDLCAKWTLGEQKALQRRVSDGLKIAKMELFWSHFLLKMMFLRHRFLNDISETIFSLILDHFGPHFRGFLDAKACRKPKRRKLEKACFT